MFKINLFLKLFEKVKYNLLMGLLFCVLVILPDYIFQAFLPNVRYLTDFVFIFVIFWFGFFLSMCGWKIYALFCLLFAFMQSIQLGHIAYFARPINPLDIGKVFTEFSDIYSESVTDIDDFWFVIPAAVLPFLALVFMQYKWRKKLFFSLWALVAVIVFLGVKPERATRRGLHHFLPPETRYSIHNSINSFSFYLVRGMDKKNLDDLVPDDFYKPYIVEKLDKSSNLVVLVMGESTSANKMHLFNPSVNLDTPQLEKLAEDPRFTYRKAYSAGVATHASLPIFFNMIKEPGNIEKLKNYDTNLFRLAKENGYKTYFFSAYDMKQTNLIGVPYIDEIITSESASRKFKAEKEDYLINLLKQLNLSDGKNFVVLNFRSVHSPYEKNYTHHPEFDVFKPQDNSRFAEENTAYENAILYIDSVLAQMINYVRDQHVENSQFIFTSDHAEILGIPNGKYGHNVLVEEAMVVPFILFNEGENVTLPKGYMTHFEIAGLVARFLGYKVVNPNSPENRFYVHGNNLFEDYQYVEFERDNNGDVKQIKKDTVSQLVKKRKGK